jgi:AcrR family transcriptional regulator
MTPNRTPQRTRTRADGAPPHEGAREALMTAATTLFAERGFDGTTVEMVARRARANKAMISYYFGGKAGLYSTILEDTLASAHGRLQAVLESPGPADERLRRFASIFVEAASRRPGFPAMVLREALSGGQHLRREALPGFVGIFTMVREIIEQGMRQGTFRAVNPFCAHLTLIGSLIFFFATRPFRDRLVREAGPPLAPIPPEEFLRHTQDLMIAGLRTGSRRRARGRR